MNNARVDSSFVQRQAIAGLTFGPGSAVTVTGGGAPGAFATYTNSAGGIDVIVTSRLLGPLASNPVNTGILEQEFFITNNTGAALSLDSVSHIDQDLEGGGGSAGGDVVAFDGATRSVFAVDSPIFMAAIADEAQGTLGWQVEVLDGFNPNFAALTNNLGPVGPNDTEMNIALSAGSLADGASATLSFRYLMATGGLQNTPSDFRFDAVVAEPGAVALLSAALLGFAARRRRTT